MLHLNAHPDYRAALDPADAALFGSAGADEAARYLRGREGHAPTPLRSLPGLAREHGLGGIFLKDEGQRLGLGSFKALGGAYAVARLALEAAGDKLGRRLDYGDLADPAVRALTGELTFACATDGNHGRSVAQGAGLVGARSVIFVHAGVSEARAEAIRRYGARIVRVTGGYDDSVVEAARVAESEGWTVVSDTSWPGYEHVPGLVMQGYTTILREALAQMPAPPTHLFVQAGVGGIAAALAAHAALVMGAVRPRFVTVDPARAACLYETARAGKPVRVPHGEATVMAMLDCYEPSLRAWRVLSRVSDGFMTVADEEAVAVMRRLARPAAGDPPVVAGESGGAGLAGVLQAAADPAMRAALGLDDGARVLAIITEGSTDPERYRELVGREAGEVSGAQVTA